MLPAKVAFLCLLLTANRVNTQGLQTCVCVPSNQCYPNLKADGGGNIDIRIVTNNGTVTPAPPPPATTQPPLGSCTAGNVRCCTECGLSYNITPTAATTPGPGQGRYGDQPWQAVLLDATNKYLGGGVLLDATHVLTAAHKVKAFEKSPAGTVKVRMGEWDANSPTIEPFQAQDRNVTSIVCHEGYNDSAKNLFNDVAILKLASPIQYGPTVNPAINTACFPTITSFDNMRCIVSGWGKNAFNGAYQAIIKQVDVPVVPNTVCQEQLRTTKLGPVFQLNTASFMCAGGEAGKDACVGDGGSPLMCNVGGRYQVAGLVAWGIGCANASIPGVYVRVQTFVPWIRSKLT